MINQLLAENQVLKDKVAELQEENDSLKWRERILILTHGCRICVHLLKLKSEKPCCECRREHYGGLFTHFKLALHPRYWQKQEATE